MAIRNDIFEQFLTATAMLTRLPVGSAAEADETVGPTEIVAASWAFPLVGAGIGGIAGGVMVLAALFGLHQAPGVLLALVAAALVTGALHEDGLADTGDGFGGGYDAAQKLAIMRDSRHGTYGVLALILGVALRATALVAIGEPIQIALALIAAHAASRALLPTMMLWLRPVREDGLAAAAGRPSLWAALTAMVIGAVITLATLGPLRGLTALVCSSIAVAATAMLARRQIGGYTGDVLGAFQQVGEIVMLLVAAAR